MTVPNLDFSAYLASIQAHYKKWWELYTLTDATGREKQIQEKQASPFDFGLMAQTVQREEPLTDEKQQTKEKIERLPVLEGIRKYAFDPTVRQVLLVGRPGSGKSTALARLLLEEAAENSGKIPVLVELRYWQGSIVELICGAFRRHGLFLLATGLDDLLSQNRLLLLFDGVNELPSEQARSQLTAFRREHSQLSMIFTTRDLSLGGDLGIEKKLEMQPLIETQMQAFVRAYLPEAQAEAMLRQLRERLRELGQTPLLLWMLCCLFQQTEQIPENLGLVFRAFTQGYERNLKQDVPIESDRDWWQPVLQELAWVMMQGEKPTELRVAISRGEARSKIAAFLQGKVDCADDFAMRCLRDLQRHHLIQAGTGDELEFRHQLIQEYYAALALLERLPKLSDEELKCNYLNYLKWTEPLALMLALIDSETTVERVVRLALEMDLVLGARLAGEAQPRFQQQAVDRVIALDVPAWLKVDLLSRTRSKDKNTVDYLSQALKNKDEVVRNRAVEVSGEIGSVELLTIALKDKQTWIRKCAVEALGKIGSVDAVKPLIAVLKDESLSLKIISALEQFDPALVLEPLIAALKDENAQARKCAARALGKIGSVEAVGPLIAALKDEETWVRRFAAEALGEIGSVEAVEPLIAALKDEKTWVQGYFAEALGKIGSVEAVEPLIAALEECQDSDPCGIVWALGEIGSVDAVGPLIAKVKRGSILTFSSGAAEALSKIDLAQAIVLLSAELEENEDARVRARVASALGEIGSTEVIKPLIAALKDEDAKVRWIATMELGEIGSIEVAEPLIAALRNECSWIRERATDQLRKWFQVVAPSVDETWIIAIGNVWITAVGKSPISYSTERELVGIGLTANFAEAVIKKLEPFEKHISSFQSIVTKALSKVGLEVVELLSDILQDDNIFVQKVAAEVLCGIRSVRVVEPLIAVPRNEDLSSLDREAIRALGEIGSVEAVEPLITALKEGRCGAEEALGKIGSVEAVEPLIAELKKGNFFGSTEAAKALGLIRSVKAVEPLITALKEDPSDGIRSEAAEALGRIGSVEAVEPLITALKEDPSKAVRSKAVWALGRIGSVEAVEPLITALKEDPSDGVRSEAAEALGKIGSVEAVEPLIAALKDCKDCKPFVRVGVILALESIDSDQTIEPLVAALKDEDEIVQDYTIQQLLKKIANPQSLGELWRICRSGDRYDFESVNSLSFAVISAIQERCRFYNYEIYQQAQAMREQARQEAKGGKAVGIDFAILTAIPTERKAVCKAFNITDEDRVRQDTRTYWRKRFPLKNGKFYEIVVAQCLDAGTSNAALLTNDTLHHWKPAAVLMVGIAAAAKSEQQLGSLVIGREVYYYETGAITAAGKLPEPKQIPVDATLLDRAQALPETDFLILAAHPDGLNIRPKIETGVIASGDKVIKDAAERDKIAAANRKIRAIEMEGYGVLNAAWQHFDQIRCLAIRALCDYADAAKNDQWHDYAAAVAAGYTHHFLSDEPLEPRNAITDR